MIEQGDFRRAKSYSRSAKRFSIAAIVTGLIFFLIAIAIVVVRVATGNFERRS